MTETQFHIIGAVLGLLIYLVGAKTTIGQYQTTKKNSCKGSDGRTKRFSA